MCEPLGRRSDRVESGISLARVLRPYANCKVPGVVGDTTRGCNDEATLIAWETTRARLINMRNEARSAAVQQWSLNGDRYQTRGISNLLVRTLLGKHERGRLTKLDAANGDAPFAPFAALQTLSLPNRLQSAQTHSVYYSHYCVLHRQMHRQVARFCLLHFDFRTLIVLNF